MDDLYCRILLPEEIIISEKSGFQQIDIVRTKSGKALILDGLLQLHTPDEFIYHEMLVHFPMIHHPHPERVLVLGGGDGFLLREILKYSSVKEVVLVDIDERVVELCKEHFAKENRRSFEDERVNVIIDDALNFAEKDSGGFDVLIMDLVEPYGIGEKLYTKESIAGFSALLKEDGIFATHCEDAMGNNHIGLKIFALLSNMFPYSKPAFSYLRSFDGLWTYAVHSKQELRPQNEETAQTERLYFEPESYERYSWLPPYLREKLEDYKKNGFEKLVESDVSTKRVKYSDTLEEMIGS
jgi:spermidine synthase